MIYGTNFRYAALVSQVTRTQNAITKLQYSVSTGNKAETFADQTNAAALVQYKSTLADHDQTLENAKMAQIRLSLAETTLTAIDDIAVKARRAASSLTWEDASAGKLKEFSKQWLAAVVDYLNTKGDNGYLFSGLSTDQKPVTYPNLATDPTWTAGPGALVTPGSPNGFFAVTTNPGPPITVTPDVAAAFGTATNTDYRNYYYTGGPGVDPNTGASDDGLKVRVDRASSVSVGFSAAEPGFEKLLRGLQILAVAPPVDETAANFQEQKATYEYYVKSAYDLLYEAAQDVRSIHNRCSSALAYVSDTLENHTLLQNAQQQIVADLQGADRTESIVKLQALQINMEASYKAIAELQDYSLVNYLR